MNTLLSIIETIDNFITTNYLVVLLLGTGIIFSIRMGFPQLFMMKSAIKAIIEKDPNAKGNKDHISPYEALMISMGTRIGTGNIVGVAIAVVLGGAGALFWIWFAAFFNGSISIIENTLGQIYKSQDGKTFKGGSPYYIAKGLNSKTLAIILAILFLLTGWTFQSFYSYITYSSISAWYVSPDSALTHSHLSTYVGLCIAIFTTIMYFGGGRYIARFTSYMTPFITITFAIVCIISICFHIERFPFVIAEIFKGAFDFNAMAGGLSGGAIMIGVQRGLFSNEAGLGTTPASSSSAATTHPVKQGIIQAFCVFVDNLVCTLSAFLILFSDAYTNKLTDSAGHLLNEMPLVNAAISETLGIYGQYYITAVIVILACTVTIGSFYALLMNMKFIKDKPIPIFIFRIFSILVVYLGAQANLSLVLSLANITMAILAITNIICIWILFKVARLAFDDFKDQQSKGLNPVFSAKKLGIKNAECWD